MVPGDCALSGLLLVTWSLIVTNLLTLLQMFPGTRCRSFLRLCVVGLLADAMLPDSGGDDGPTVLSCTLMCEFAASPFDLEGFSQLFSCLSRSPSLSL